MPEPSIEDVLAAHPRGAATASGSGVECDCGEWLPTPQGWSTAETFRAHVADALRAAGYGQVREAQAAAWDEGWNAGLDIQPNSDNPYRAGAGEGR